MSTHSKKCFSWGKIRRLYDIVAKPFKILGKPGIINVKFSRSWTLNASIDLSLCTLMLIFIHFNIIGHFCGFKSF